MQIYSGHPRVIPRHVCCTLAARFSLDSRPFVDLGLDNSIPDTRFLHHPYVSYGDVAHFEGSCHALFILGKNAEAACLGLSSQVSGLTLRKPGFRLFNLLRCHHLV
jgi:hypothetical protein